MITCFMVFPVSQDQLHAYALVVLWCRAGGRVTRDLFFILRASWSRIYSSITSSAIIYLLSPLNLDGRLVNVDHSLTEDLQAFFSSVAHLYSHISKPLLDVVLMTGAVARMARKRGENSPWLLRLTSWWQKEERLPQISSFSHHR